VAVHIEPDRVNRRERAGAKGLRQFLDDEQQRAWLNGEGNPSDAERSESLEQRFKYAARFEKLLRRPQAEHVLDILRLYGATCLPVPRTTERWYWSVSCLPGSPDKPLARVNASWMELFALLRDQPSPLWGCRAPAPSGGRRARGMGGGASAARADGADERFFSAADASGPPHSSSPTKGEGLRARIILHLSDFTTDGSPEPEHLDRALLESCVDDAANLTHFFWKADTFGVKVRTAASIRAFLTHPHALRAIRRFNLTHLNRGRNAYQASHCYSLADAMVGE
jgi:hypothetical protein